MIEDQASNISMIVMNDRPQAGSAYYPGRIELLIHRTGTTDDDLGANSDVRETFEG